MSQDLQVQSFVFLVTIVKTMSDGVWEHKWALLNY